MKGKGSMDRYLVSFVESHDPTVDVTILYEDREAFLEEVTSDFLVNEGAA